MSKDGLREEPAQKCVPASWGAAPNAGLRVEAFSGFGMLLDVCAGLWILGRMCTDVRAMFCVYVCVFVGRASFFVFFWEGVTKNEGGKVAYMREGQEGEEGSDHNAKKNGTFSV